MRLRVTPLAPDVTGLFFKIVPTLAAVDTNQLFTNMRFITFVLPR